MDQFVLMREKMFEIFSSRVRGCRNIDVLAKRTRERIHRLFYDWGCILQRHHFAVFFIGMLLLVLPCCGVKYLRVETDMENLLIESEGRLHDEVKFTKEQYGLNGFGEQEFGYETIIQTVQDEEENILTKKGMKEHLSLLMKVMDLEVETIIEGKSKKWGVRDFCFKHDVPFFQANADVATLIRRLSPCYIMTPLDCFFEGAYIAAHPDTLNITNFNYVKKSPNQIMESLKGYAQLYQLFVDTVGVEKFMKKTGTDTGYQIKSCLDPTDVNCLLKNEQNLDIGEKLTGGCQGIARNYMRWPEDLIVSGVEKNESGFIKRAKALQSVIAILQPASFAKYVDHQKKSDISNFTKAHAKQILDTWKNEFIKLVNKEGKKRGSTTKMMAFSTVSFQHLIDQQTMFQKGSSAFGAILIVFYAIVTLKRWSNAIHSYGAMGLIGVILVSLSVTNGLGLSYFLGMPLSALSTQVLPYLAVGLGLDNMFLLVRTYVFVCDSGKFTDKQIVGMCLGECGLSITITSFANTCAFFMASIIPIVTLQDFARQASIIVAVNWFTVIFVLPAILSFDVERQKDKRYDLWCCFKQNDAETDDTVTRRSNVKKNLNMNFSGNNTLDLPFSLQNTPVKTEQPANKNNGSQPPHKFVLDRSRRQFNVKPPPAVPPDESQEQSLCSSIIQKVSLTYFAQNYYGRWLCCVQVKIIVLFLCCIQLFIAAYGSTKVKKGLNLVDIVPRNTPAHDFMSARKKYFSYYNFHMVTKAEEDGREFDYSTLKNQRILLEFDRRIRKVKNVLDVKDKNESGIWLSIYSNWLKESEKIFLREWKLKKISHRCINRHTCTTKHIEAELIYLLLSTTQNEDFLKRKKFNATLVNEEGLVNPRWFYYGLTLWYWFDNLGTAKSEIGMRPEPLRPRLSGRVEDARFMHEEFMAAPEIMLIPYAAHNLVTDEDYINLIKDIRSVCDEFQRKYNLPTFPKGIPFTYWEQFIFLERYLVLAGGVVLASTGVFILITFMSLRAAIMVVFFLVVTVFEVYGCLGLFHIELSAISAVTLIMSVGVAFEFTVHIVLAFINTPGDRNNRMRGALEITFAPMIDSAMSTIIMITLLSTSQFDFVVKYFFTLILCLICIALVNGVLVLPVVLSFFGPCCEVTNRSVGPTMNPVYCIPITIDISAHFHHEHNWRNVTDLSTIPEVSERSSPTIKTVDDDHASTVASKSSRPLTPFFPTTTLVQEQSDYQMQHNNDIDIEKATFKNKSDKQAWHHTPQLHKNENGEYTNERSGRYCYASRKKKHNVRQFPPCNTRGNTNNNHISRTSQTVRSMNTSENLKNFNNNNMINESNDINYNNGGDINYITNNSDKFNNNIKNINNQIINNNTNNRNNNDNNIYSNNSSNNTIILHNNNKNNNNINLNNNNNINCNTNTSNTRINNNQPRVIRVQPRDDSSSNTSRCSTKLKATLSIELETSHPYGVTSTACHDGYEDGMTRVEF